jgi:hypothetical protein
VVGGNARKGVLLAIWEESEGNRERLIIPFPTPNRATGRGRLIVRDMQAKGGLLTTEEFADKLGFSVRTITGWACAWEESGGQQGIPGRKIGRGWRFESSLVDDMREGRFVVRTPGNPKNQRKTGPITATA